MKLIKELLNNLWKEQFVYIVLVVIMLVFGLVNPRFFTLENFAVIGRQTAIVAVVAFGMTFVLTSHNVDLSVGSIVGLVVMIATMSLEAGAGVLLSSLAGIGAGLLVGLFNGLVTVQFGIPSFLVTLGTMGIARGIAMTVTNNMVVVVYDKKFTAFWGAGTIGGFPTVIVLMLVFFFLAYFVYHHTPYGNYIKATGDNAVAARYSGVSTKKIVLSVMIINALFASFAGLMMIARINAGRPEVGNDLPMDAISAVILGGTSLHGGKGSIVRTLTGALIIGMITNALIIFGFDYSLQMVVRGLIIITAVVLTERNKK
jgi:ribose transport system permease protein